MNIESINAVEHAASAGHMAAAQYFLALFWDVGWNGCWISPEINGDDHEGIEKALRVLGEYVCCRELMPGQLMSYAGLERIRAEDADLDVHRARAWAYDLFAVTARHAFGLTSDEQRRIAEEKAHLARLEATQPLRLEDSIFEQHGSLGEMQKHAGEMFIGMANYDQAMAEEKARLELLQEQARVTAEIAAASGVPLELLVGAPEPSPTTPSITIGSQEQSHEEKTAGQGQEAGGAAPDAPQAPDAVRPAGEAGPASADEEGLRAAGVAPAGEAGPAPEMPGDDGAGAVTPWPEPAQEPALEPKKPGKAKPAN